MCPMCAPTVQPERACCCNLHLNHATRAPDQIDAMPSQREGQLEDVDYQTAPNPLAQSESTASVFNRRIRAGPLHGPTVDGVEQGRQGPVDDYTSSASPRDSAIRDGNVR